TTSHWTGIGTTEDAAIDLQATLLPPLCVGESGTITVTITNTGESNLTVSGLEMEGGPFRIDASDLAALPYTIASGESREVRIEYTATKGTQRSNLRVTSDAVNTQTGGVSLQEVSGTGLDETWNTRLVLQGTKNNGELGELGKEVVAELWLDETFNGMPTGMTMTSYDVVLEYDATLLTPRRQSITGGAGTSGGAVVTTDAGGSDMKNGRLVLHVSGFMVSRNDALLRVPFAVLFSDSLSRAVRAEVTTDGNCVEVKGSEDEIAIDPICGLDLRMIELTSVNYTLDQNKPNPFNPVTKIRYALGLDGQATLQLYDAQGRLVQVLVDEYQQPGVYELTLDVTNLASGNYYYTLVSGDYKETRMLTVTK